MEIFEAFRVAVVPFPYVERPVLRRRPCLAIASTGGPHRLAWVLMITSADNQRWPGDVPISDLESAGLPAPSMIRTAKIATVETAMLDFRGRLAEVDASLLRRELSVLLSPALAGARASTGAWTLEPEPEGDAGRNS